MLDRRSDEITMRCSNCVFETMEEITMAPTVRHAHNIMRLSWPVPRLDRRLLLPFVSIRQQHVRNHASKLADPVLLQ